MVTLCCFAFGLRTCAMSRKCLHVLRHCLQLAEHEQVQQPPAFRVAVRLLYRRIDANSFWVISTTTYGNMRDRGECCMLWKCRALFH